jgi:DNA primase
LGAVIKTALDFYLYGVVMSRGYKAVCQKCGGHNLYVTPDNGIEYCFNCGYSNAQREDLLSTYVPLFRTPEYLVELRGFYKRVASYYHSCVTPAIRVHLNSRGVTDSHIELYKIGYVPAGAHALYEEDIAGMSGIVSRSGQGVLRGRIVFPYFDPYAGDVTDIRGRHYDSPEPEVKYKGPYGSAVSRGSDEWPFNSFSKSEDSTILVTEGEIKSIVASDVIRTVGVPGINSWRYRLRSMFKEHQKVVIVFDSQSDTKVQTAVHKAIDKLASRLPNAHVATLPLSGSKTDLDEFVLTKGADSLKLIVDKSLPYDTWAKLQRRETHVPRHYR